MLQRPFQEIPIMTKNFLFAVALLSLALASGCAKGGNGTVPPLHLPLMSTTATFP